VKRRFHRDVCIWKIESVREWYERSPQDQFAKTYGRCQKKGNREFIGGENGDDQKIERMASMTFKGDRIDKK
jgi:N-acetylneuraminic acid mutarotase